MDWLDIEPQANSEEELQRQLKRMAYVFDERDPAFWYGTRALSEVCNGNALHGILTDPDYARWRAEVWAGYGRRRAEQRPYWRDEDVYPLNDWLKT